MCDHSQWEEFRVPVDFHGVVFVKSPTVKIADLAIRTSLGLHLKFDRNWSRKCRLSSVPPNVTDDLIRKIVEEAPKNVCGVVVTGDRRSGDVVHSGASCRFDRFVNVVDDTEIETPTVKTILRVDGLPANFLFEVEHPPGKNLLQLVTKIKHNIIPAVLGDKFDKFLTDLNQGDIRVRVLHNVHTLKIDQEEVEEWFNRIKDY